MKHQETSRQKQSSYQPLSPSIPRIHQPHTQHYIKHHDFKRVQNGQRKCRMRHATHPPGQSIQSIYHTIQPTGHMTLPSRERHHYHQQHCPINNKRNQDRCHQVRHQEINRKVGEIIHDQWCRTQLSGHRYRHHTPHTTNKCMR